MSKAIAWLISCMLTAGLGFSVGWVTQQQRARPAPAAAPAMMPAVNWQRTWDQALRTLTAPERWSELRSIVTQWAEQDASAAVAAVQRLPDASERWSMLPNAVGAWAQRAPRDATDWVLQLEPSALRSESLLVALRELASKDPQTAVAMAAQLPHREQREQLPRVLVQWSQRDLAATMQYLEGLQDVPLRNLTIVGIAGDYGRRDIEAAITWASALPAAQSELALRSVLFALKPQDPARASRMLGILKDADERFLAAREIAESWAESDVTAALAWAFQQPDAAQRTELIEAVFRRWCDFDAAAASQQLAQLQDPVARDAAAVAVATNRFVPIAVAEQAQLIIVDAGRRRKVAEWLYHRLQGYGHDAALVERYRQEAGITSTDTDRETLDEFSAGQGYLPPPAD